MGECVALRVELHFGEEAQLLPEATVGRDNRTGGLHHCEGIFKREAARGHEVVNADRAASRYACSTTSSMSVRLCKKSPHQCIKTLPPSFSAALMKATVPGR